FGCQNRPPGMAQLLVPLLPTTPGAIAIELILSVIAVASAVTIATVEDLQDGLDLLSERSRVFLLIGCALIVACFFAAQNATYREIYFLLILPGITHLWRAPVS